MLRVIEAYRTGLCVFDLLQSSVVVFNYLKALCRFVLHGSARITTNVNINLKKKSLPWKELLENVVYGPIFGADHSL